MHRTIWIALLALSLILAACAPANNSATVEPTQGAAGALTAAVPSTGMDLDTIDPAAYSGDIYVAGSSTVYPVTERIAEMFKADGFEGQGNVRIDSIGSGAGFERFCVNAESDIANASRAINEEEVTACQENGREPIEFRVGTDALAIVVNPGNEFVAGLTLEELAMIFSNEAASWSDVNPNWPAEPIKRYAPGTDSGTFDFFIEEVMQPVYGDERGEQAFLQAENLQASEDDNVLVQGVAGDPYAIGFFGYAYFEENAAQLKILSVEGVEPSFETAESGDYPLARPLFIYSDAAVMQEKPQVAAFIGYYLTYVSDIIAEVGYFPASQAALDAARQSWTEAAAGQ
ncbi:MAG TPA: PstS family phosphate ABC transporter substrate-binding protein [Anaerolineaceae bacterium]|nr:PstS family phosphate ABC transporter substrate-binding protein [Anaerolineaceae bacterium]